MYRNTPMQGIKLSPSQIVFGRELRDTMPFKPGKGAMHKEWLITAVDREKALAKRHHTNMEKLNEHVKELKKLQVGQSVLVQNQSGNHGKRWARTGTVVETGPGPRQYAVRMDGSRNVSIRNRKFLRPFTGVADMMADNDALDDTVPQQHSDDRDDRAEASLIVRQEASGGAQSDTVDIVAPDDVTAEEIPLTPSSQVQDAGRTDIGVSHRYPGRFRRKPARFKDYEMDDSG